MTSPRVLSCIVVTISALTPLAAAQFAEDDVRVVHVFSGEAPGDSLGWAVSALVDIDGDGITDLIIPAPDNDANGSRSGRIYVHSGATGAAIPGMTFTGPFAGARLGHAIADAGDVNGDGIHDIIGGAPGPNGSAGLVQIFSGVDGSIIREVSGEATGDGFGYSVAGLGDVNGDGLGEVVVGAPGHDTGGAGSGRVYILSGKDGGVLHTSDGQKPGDALGSGIGPASDLNGDLAGDFIAGAPGGGADGRGRAVVLSGTTAQEILPPLQPEPTGASFGQFFVSGCGDADADGTPDLYVGDYADSVGYVYSGIDGSRLLTLGFPGGFGCGRGAGDVDGDGHADLAVGAYQGAGRVYLISGADGTVLRTITSTTSGESFGFDAVGAGDVDGDGLTDILVGAAGAAGNRAYVIAGNAPSCPPDVDKNGTLDLFDFLAYVNLFNASDPDADCTADGLLDLFDFLCYVNAFSAGC
jgi:hypothetical protein